MGNMISVIVKSHIDPVWLWNLSQGRRVWSNTVTTVVSLLKENPDMTFSCSTAQLYRWIEETNPSLFNEVKTLVEEGRWEIVGGWEVQSDAVISSGESLRRQGLSGKTYFMERFGIDVRTAFCVDSFGHSGDLPDILAETGFDNYVYCRSQTVPELFRWKGAAGHSINTLYASRGYGMHPGWTREEFFAGIKETVDREGNAKALFLGIGDHGGGVPRTHLRWMHEAMQEYPLKFSTLSKYFAEHVKNNLPEYSGDLGPIFRGCYSVNHSVKQAVAKTEALLLQAERLGDNEVRKELEPAWREVLLANFHDSLSGTCIRETYERDILPMLGGAACQAQKTIDVELARRESRLDTSFAHEGGIYAVNLNKNDGILPISYQDFIDPNLSGMHFNALQAEDGELLPVQILPPDTTFGPGGCPWGRITTVLPVKAQSEKVWALIRGGESFPDVDIMPLQKLLGELEWQIYADDTGTWGHELERYAYDTFYSIAKLDSVKTSTGSVCAELEAKYCYKNSTILLKLTAYRSIPEIKLSVECNWYDAFTALKLAWRSPDCGAERILIRQRQNTSVEHLVKMGWMKQWIDGEIRKCSEGTGELPFLKWCALKNGGKTAGFYSADLHGCDAVDDLLRITMLRCLPYAYHKCFKPKLGVGMTDEGRTNYELWFWNESPERLETMSAMSYCEITPHGRLSY